MNWLNAVLAAIVVGIPLSWLYLYERTKNVAKQASEKALRDFTHESDKRFAELTANHAYALQTSQQDSDNRLADLSAEHAHELEQLRLEIARQAAGSALYAQERHRAYPELYRLYRNAIDAWYRAMLTGYSQDAKVVIDALEALRAAKHTEALEDLYLSNGVRDYIECTRELLARFSGEVTPKAMPGDPASTDRLMAKYQAADAAGYRLRDAMREELRAAVDIKRPTDREWQEWLGPGIKRVR